MVGIDSFLFADSIMEEEIQNKVEKSGLINIDLEDFYTQGERVLIDIKDYLFQELILREKDFRQAMADHDWSSYKGKLVAVHCSIDAIIPSWAYMLMAVNLQPHAKKVIFGDLDTLETFLFQQSLQSLDLTLYQDERVIINGCGNVPIHDSAYVEISMLLKPIVKSIMFGEACSTVPLYKRPSS